jgi:hypothetical protein
MSFITENFSKSQRGEATFRQVDTLTKLFGPPSNFNQLNVENLEPNDIWRYYEGRILELPAAYISAYLRNAVNSPFLKVIIPWVQTNEKYIRSSWRDLNVTVFQNVGEGAPFNTLTSREGAYLDITQKKKLGMTIASGVYTDEIFGDYEFNYYMTGLSQSAALTIMLDECFALILHAFLNATRDQNGKDTIDYSKILNTSGHLFGSFPLDPMICINRIEEIRESHLPGLDTCVLPERVLSFLKQIQGGKSQMVQQEIIYPIQQNGSYTIKVGFQDGVMSDYTLNGVDFFELKRFVVNGSTSLTTKYIQPLKTNVCVGRSFTHREIGDCDDLSFSECNNDIQIYCMDDKSGQEEKICYRMMLKYCFLFNIENGNPSEYLKSYVDFKNNELYTQIMGLPPTWRQLQKIRKNGKFDVNADEGVYDYSYPMKGSFETKKTVEEMAEWRSQCGFITFNPDVGNYGKYFVPNRLGDLNKFAFPNHILQKICSKMVKHFKFQTDFNLESLLDKTVRFLTLIDQAEWSDEYVKQLLLINYERLKLTGDGKINEDSYEKRQEREAINGPKYAIDWTPNIFGGMDLPLDSENQTETYPPGFANAAGLRTIAAQKNSNKRISYNSIAETADNLIEQLNILVSYMKKYFGNTDIVSEIRTPPWFSKIDSLETLIGYIFPQNPPLFLGVYAYDFESGFVTKDIKEPDNPFITWKNKDENKKLYEALFQENVPTKTIVDALLDDGEERGIPSNLIFPKLWKFIILGLDIKDKLITLSKFNNFDVLINTLMDYIFAQPKESPKPIEFNYDNITNTFIQDATHLKDEILKRVFKSRIVLNDLETASVKNKDPVKKLFETNYITKINEVDVTKNGFNYNEFVIQYTASFLKIMKNIKNDYAELKLIMSDAGVDEKKIKENIALWETKKKPSRKVPIKSEKPIGYVRVPLNSSQAFLDYLQYKQGDADILIGDPATNYNTPLYSKGDSSKLLKKGTFSKQSTFENVSLSNFPLGASFDMKHKNINVNQKGLISKPIKKSNTVDMEIDDDDDEKELFNVTKKTSHTMKKSYSDNVSEFMSKKFVDPMKFDAHFPKESTLPYSFTKEFDTSKPIDPSIHAREFPGPWEANINFLKNMTSIAEGLFYQAIIFAPFTREIFDKFAQTGLHLLRLEYIRNAEEHEMNSMIVLKKGSDTMVMAYGRITVLPSVDGITGAVTFWVEFDVGAVRRNDRNIDWIPYVVPYKVVGGHQSTVIKNPMDFFQKNSNGRPSIFVMAHPISESKLGSPRNLFNKPIFNAPSMDSTGSIFIKSSSADYYQFMLGKDQILNVIGKMKTITNYYQYPHLTFTIWRGAVRKGNNRGKYGKIEAGNGIKGDIRMNMLDAYLGWNGVKKFPEKIDVDKLNV